MNSEEKVDLNRVLCKVGEVLGVKQNQIVLDQKSFNILEINNSNFSSNYGLVSILLDTNNNSNFSVRFDTQLAQTLGLSTNDYVEIFKIADSLFLNPILSQELTNHFFNVYGSKIPRIILLSSHPIFESHTPEIANGIYHHLQDFSIPTLRIESRQHFIEGNQKIDATISRYEVDITRLQDEPLYIANKWVNRNASYRVLANLYFQLLSQYLMARQCSVVVDVHGLAFASSAGVIHPEVIVGDALTKNPLVEAFTRTIETSTRPIIQNLRILYRPPWGMAEHTLSLVKSANKIPIIIEIRKDLRHYSQWRNKLIDVISNALKDLIQNLPSFE